LARPALPAVLSESLVTGLGDMGKGMAQGAWLRFIGPIGTDSQRPQEGSSAYLTYRLLQHRSSATFAPPKSFQPVSRPAHQVTFFVLRRIAASLQPQHACTLQKPFVVLPAVLSAGALPTHLSTSFLKFFRRCGDRCSMPDCILFRSAGWLRKSSPQSH
jgi:hypothetical protein